MEFRRQNANQRQAGPLPETETSEELCPRVLQGGLYAINGGDGQKSPRTNAAKVSCQSSAVNAEDKHGS